MDDFIEPPRSPKRRRILASINPPTQDLDDDSGPTKPSSKSSRRDPTMSPERAAVREDEDGDDDTKRSRRSRSKSQDNDPNAPRATRFRFKSKSSKSSRSSRRREDDDPHRSHRRHRSRSRSRDRDRDHDEGRSRHRHRRRERDDPDRDSHRRHRGSHHHHHRRRHHRHRSKSPSNTNPEDDPYLDPPLSPNTAFRESLFDAMADDEGAAYWEAVYGQPIHIYAPPGSGPSGGGGELERMTDDEYAAYVRQKMWEKTHAGLLEARARREREREEAARRAEEEARVAREMERALRRGEERRRKRAMRDGWERYRTRWAEWEERMKNGGGGDGVDADGDGIPWPDGVGEVRGAEIQRDKVRAFFVNGIGLEELGEKEFAARLKEERVRWHPDKMLQRLGGKVDEAVMRDVTAIFQVVDALWNDTRKSA
ncbi:hypothetical protein VTJ49DRAFT_6341 [Mycothermus thermophilus]|uniref:Uncharacterized protein n=1 Tax=Humicola insolens TaxID=85995 RepID=A0ABR3V1H0_HUMIN